MHALSSTYMDEALDALLQIVTPFSHPSILPKYITAPPHPKATKVTKESVFVQRSSDIFGHQYPFSSLALWLTISEGLFPSLFIEFCLSRALTHIASHLHIHGLLAHALENELSNAEISMEPPHPTLVAAWLIIHGGTSAWLFREHSPLLWAVAAEGAVAAAVESDALAAQSSASASPTATKVARSLEFHQPVRASSTSECAVGVVVTDDKARGVGDSAATVAQADRCSHGVCHGWLHALGLADVPLIAHAAGTSSIPPVDTATEDTGSVPACAAASPPSPFLTTNVAYAPLMCRHCLACVPPAQLRRLSLSVLLALCCTDAAQVSAQLPTHADAPLPPAPPLAFTMPSLPSLPDSPSTPQWPRISLSRLRRLLALAARAHALALNNAPVPAAAADHRANTHTLPLAVAIAAACSAPALPHLLSIHAHMHARAGSTPLPASTPTPCQPAPSGAPDTLPLALLVCAPRYPLPPVPRVLALLLTTAHHPSACVFSPYSHISTTLPPLARDAARALHSLSRALLQLLPQLTMSCSDATNRPCATESPAHSHSLPTAVAPHHHARHYPRVDPLTAGSHAQGSSIPSSPSPLASLLLKGMPPPGLLLYAEAWRLAQWLHALAPLMDLLVPACTACATNSVDAAPSSPPTSELTIRTTLAVTSQQLRAVTQRISTALGSLVTPLRAAAALLAELCPRMSAADVEAVITHVPAPLTLACAHPLAALSVSVPAHVHSQSTQLASAGVSSIVTATPASPASPSSPRSLPSLLAMARSLCSARRLLQRCCPWCVCSPALAYTAAEAGSSVEIDVGTVYPFSRIHPALTDASAAFAMLAGLPPSPSPHPAPTIAGDRGEGDTPTYVAAQELTEDCDCCYCERGPAGLGSLHAQLQSRTAILVAEAAEVADAVTGDAPGVIASTAHSSEEAHAHLPATTPTPLLDVLLQLVAATHVSSSTGSVLPLRPLPRVLRGSRLGTSPLHVASAWGWLPMLAPLLAVPRAQGWVGSLAWARRMGAWAWVQHANNELPNRTLDSSTNPLLLQLLRACVHLCADPHPSARVAGDVIPSSLLALARRMPADAHLLVAPPLLLAADLSPLPLHAPLPLQVLVQLLLVARVCCGRCHWCRPIAAHAAALEYLLWATASVCTLARVLPATTPTLLLPAGTLPPAPTRDLAEHLMSALDAGLQPFCRACGAHAVELQQALATHDANVTTPVLASLPPVLTAAMTAQVPRLPPGACRALTLPLYMSAAGDVGDISATESPTAPGTCLCQPLLLANPEQACVCSWRSTHGGVDVNGRDALALATLAAAAATDAHTDGSLANPAAVVRVLRARQERWMTAQRALHEDARAPHVWPAGIALFSEGRNFLRFREGTVAAAVAFLLGIPAVVAAHAFTPSIPQTVSVDRAPAPTFADTVAASCTARAVCWLSHATRAQMVAALVPLASEDISSSPSPGAEAECSHVMGGVIASALPLVGPSAEAPAVTKPSVFVSTHVPPQSTPLSDEFADDPDDTDAPWYHGRYGGANVEAATPPHTPDASRPVYTHTRSLGQNVELHPGVPAAAAPGKSHARASADTAVARRRPTVSVDGLFADSVDVSDNYGFDAHADAAAQLSAGTDAEAASVEMFGRAHIVREHAPRCVRMSARTPAVGGAASASVSAPSVTAPTSARANPRSSRSRPVSAVSQPTPMTTAARATAAHHSAHAREASRPHSGDVAASVATEPPRAFSPLPSPPEHTGPGTEALEDIEAFLSQLARHRQEQRVQRQRMRAVGRPSRPSTPVSTPSMGAKAPRTQGDEALPRTAKSAPSQSASTALPAATHVDHSRAGVPSKGSTTTGVFGSQWSSGVSVDALRANSKRSAARGPPISRIAPQPSCDPYEAFAAYSQATGPSTPAPSASTARRRYFNWHANSPAQEHARSARPLPCTPKAFGPTAMPHARTSPHTSGGSGDRPRRGWAERNGNGAHGLYTFPPRQPSMPPYTPKRDCVPPAPSNLLEQFMRGLARSLYTDGAMPPCLVELLQLPHTPARVLKLCYLELLKRTHPDKQHGCTEGEREVRVAAFERLRDLWRTHGSS